jgi:hypothetical protein
MSKLKSGVLYVLLGLLPACGQQLVEFPKPSTDAGTTAAGDAGNADAPDGAGNTDAARADAGSSDGAKAGAGSADGGPATDAGLATDSGFITDAGLIIDAGLTTDSVLIDAALIDVGLMTDAGLVDSGKTGDVATMDSGLADSSVDGGPCAQLPVALASAGNFVVLAGSTVTNTGPSSVTGDLGVSPGTAVTGFPPGAIVGAQHAGTPTAAQGVADLTTAYNDAAGRTLCPVTVAGNLGGQTLAPGLYKSTSSLEISSGDLTLDAQGDGNAVFIFQMASTLTTTAGRQVILTGGAKSANVFWQVGTSATLGTTSAFRGTIMADQAITLNTGATLNGRALARIAAVTLDSNTIVKPAP